VTGLQTRKPTGLASWPTVLIEGGEKAGKTYAALALSASEKVGRTFAFDLGEGSLDEYAPLGRFEIVDYDGTYRDLAGKLEAARLEPRVQPDLPNAIVIDTGTALWAALCAEANTAARRSRYGRSILQRDPDAEVPVSMDKWNTANKKWRAILDPLLAWDGIVVITARGKEVAEVEDGRPVEGSKLWKVEAQKSLGFDSNAWIRLPSPRKAQLVAIRSLRVTVPEDGPLDLPAFTLEGFLFDLMGLDAKTTAARPIATLDADEMPADWFEQWKAKVACSETSEQLSALWREAVDQANAGRIGDEDMGELQAFLREAHEQLSKSTAADDTAAADAESQAGAA
jgi:hypothetical protein